MLVKKLLYIHILICKQSLKTGFKIFKCSLHSKLNFVNAHYYEPLM